MSKGLPEALYHLTRFSTPAAERAWAERLGLPWDAVSQDWPLESADAALLPRLLPILQESGLSDDERFTLMALTVTCMNDVVERDQRFPEEWTQLEALLRERASLHASTILYWADTSWDDGFAIAERMAELWRSIEPQLMAGLQPKTL